MPFSKAPRKEWVLKSVDERAVGELSEALGLKRPVARLLVSRGLASVEEVTTFLQNGDKALHDPLLFRSMPAAIDRLARAREAGERVVIHGDYDVDGVTATALLVRFLRAHGWIVDYFLPRRLEEGYGVAVETVRALAGEGHQLLLTVDCGVTAHDAVAAANALGLDVIVTDHHEPAKGPLPEAVAVLDPHCDGYPFTELAGVGVAYKLACALQRALHLGEPLPEALVDLVAVGTVGDVVRLCDENRALCVQGLRRLRAEPNVGLRALCEVMDRPLAAVDATGIAFGIAPRINAAGRLDDPAVAIRMLLTDDATEARAIAHTLDRVNNERRAVENAVFDEASRMLEGDPSLAAPPVVLLAREDWHRGVIGVVASRLVERLHKPVVLVAVEADGRARGSARSVEGVHITDLFRACEDCLLACGGHEMAAGLSLEAERLPEFRRRLAEAAAAAGVERAPGPVLHLDGELQLDEIDGELVSQLQCLEPYGTGNPVPRFCTRGLDLSGCARIVGNNHLKIDPPVSYPRRLSVIAFGRGGLLDRLDWRQVDLAYELSIHQYQGAEFPQLKVVDIRGDGRGGGSDDRRSERRATPPRAVAKDAGEKTPPRQTPRRTAGPVTVFDARGETLSLELLGIPQKRRVPAAVFVDEPEDAEPFHDLLRERYGRERVATAPATLEPLADWAAGGIDCVVTTTETFLAALADPLLEGKRRPGPGVLLAFCTVTPAADAVRRIAEGCAWLAPAVAARLCWTAELLARERERALELLPDRGALARVYTVLRRNAREGRVDLLQLGERLKSYRLGQPALETALRIFHECDVAEWDLARQEVRLRAAENKRDLEESKTFARCAVQRAPLAAWYEQVARADSETLFDLLGFPPA